MCLDWVNYKKSNINWGWKSDCGLNFFDRKVFFIEYLVLIVG